MSDAREMLESAAGIGNVTIDLDEIKSWLSKNTSGCRVIFVAHAPRTRGDQRERSFRLARPESFRHTWGSKQVRKVKGSALGRSAVATEAAARSAVLAASPWI